VCGYPTTSGSGDLYGGGHYIDSSAATMTLQGRAIKQAAIDFGDGKTLPFTPCKKGYIPIINGKEMVACQYHNTKREKRLAKEDGKVRAGEADPEKLFWSKVTKQHSQHDNDGAAVEKKRKSC
jgi:hypothetical protein